MMYATPNLFAGVPEKTFCALAYRMLREQLEAESMSLGSNVIHIVIGIHIMIGNNMIHIVKHC
jgi:hypothetical protein